SSRRRHTRSKRDWSSDVCSSDLEALALFVIVILQAVLKRLEGFPLGTVELFRDLHLDDHILVAAAAPVEVLDALPAQTELGAALRPFQIGRASCRERVYITVVGVLDKTKDRKDDGTSPFQGK